MCICIYIPFNLYIATVHKCIHMCICIYIYVYVCGYVCMCVYVLIPFPQHGYIHIPILNKHCFEIKKALMRFT